jgi:hypothetical protein
MATANIVGGTADGVLLKSSGVSWAACLAATPSVDTTLTATQWQKTLNGSAYNDWRIYWCFDMSPYAGTTITAATVNFYLEAYYLIFASKMFYNDWGTSLTAADWGNLAVPASDEFTHATHSDIHLVSIPLLNPQNILTYNGRIEVCHTDQTTAPVNNDNGNRVKVMMADHATAGYRPSLDITYTTAATCPVSLLRHRSNLDLGGLHG